MMANKILQVLAVSLLFAIPSIRAQRQQTPSDSSSGNATTPLPPLVPADTNSNTGGAPAPAARGLFIGPDTQPQDASQPLPDTHVLSDSVAMGVGSGRRNIFNISMHASQAVDTGITPGVVNSTTAFGGSLSLDQFWNRHHFTLEYGGAESLFHPSSYNNAAYHNFSASHEIRWNRWRLRLRDDVQVSPQATFGGLDRGGSGLLSQIQVPDIALPSVAPGQTILTGRADRLQNVALADVNYRTSPRGTLTFSGSYVWLHFLTSGYVDSRNAQGRVGYDYSLDSKNSIAVIYGYSQGDFSGSNNQIQSQNLQFAYGRKITGRLALQVAAGPQFLNRKNFGPQSGQSWSWSAFSALSYRMRRTTYALQYAHAASTGSGVFLGSDNHSVTGSVTHNFTRNWSASTNAGYSINRNLVSSNVVSNRFDTWSAGASLNRQQGRYLFFSLLYGYQQQSNTAGACPVVACGSTEPRHIASVTVNWHMRPVTFE